MNNIVKSVFVISLMMCAGDMFAQTQNTVNPTVQVPAYELGKIELAPPVMVTGVTLSSPNDPVKIPGITEQGNANSSQAIAPNVNLSINIPVIEATEKNQVKGK